MAEEKKTKESGKFLTAKASVDFPVTVIATEVDPYHETGTEFEAGCKKAIELEKRGWVKLTEKANERIKELKSLKLLSIMFLLSLFSISAGAQTSVLSNLVSVHNVASDTVTDTGTIYLQSVKVSGPAQSTTIQVNVTKISGTVGGTISLQGSLDGTNFKALNTEETQTALATITATDASNVYHWRLKGSPFLYYRVSWTGTGTMSASFTAKIMKH